MFRRWVGSASGLAMMTAVEALRRGRKVRTGNAVADVQLPFQMRHLGLWTDATAAPAGDPT